MRSTEAVRNAVIWGIVWGAALALVLAGCGSSTSSNAPATIAAACTQLHEANAARSARCFGGSVADWLANIDNQEDCAAYTRHVAEHQAEYVPQGFAACLAAYEKPCDQAPGNCTYEILHGLVADGQPCQETEVCGVVSGCLPFGTGPCGGQVCGQLAIENQTCGFYCGGATPCFAAPICAGDLACVNDVCVERKGLGESCGGADPTPCSALLACSADPADPQSTGTCQHRTAGAACHVDGDCPGDQFCSQGTCVARRALGAACADVPSSCVTWTTCDATSGLCVAAGRPGQPCAPYPGSPGAFTCTVGVCLDGITCTAYASTGGSCAMAGCGPGDTCDATTTTCVACPL